MERWEKLSNHEAAMIDRLKSCPFCGGEAMVKFGGMMAWVECRNCCAKTRGNIDKEKAIKWWNMRAEVNEDEEE